MVTSGIRLGSPAITTRGFKEEHGVSLGALLGLSIDLSGIALYDSVRDIWDRTLTSFSAGRFSNFY